MKIKFLGTAAAEGVPALYCECDVCKTARELGDKEIRTRSQTLIDNKLLIDYPADTYFHSLIHNFDLKDIHHYLITHVHADHFYPNDLNMTAPGFANLKDNTITYNFYGGAEMVTTAKKVLIDSAKVTLHTLEAFKTYTISDYKVTPLPACHGTETPLIYIIESEHKRILYAHDTGIFPDETLNYLIKNKLYFNLVSWDCCSGNEDVINYDSHLCMGYIRDLKKKLEEHGIFNNKTIHCVNHFSHNGKNVLYKERAVYEKDGFVMSHDGFEIEF